jgi:FKBP-type peptidyl-prolyl cis-trans isomerase (trigger factor)
VTAAATKQDVDDLRRDVRQDLERFATKQDLEGLARAMQQHLAQTTAELREDLLRAIEDGATRTANVMMEQTRIHINALGERYQDVPRELTQCAQISTSTEPT